jgi:hypothetical protein
MLSRSKTIDLELLMNEQYECKRYEHQKLYIESHITRFFPQICPSQEINNTSVEGQKAQKPYIRSYAEHGDKLLAKQGDGSLLRSTLC